ncbi:SDR family oxidoreductase [Rhodococcus aetherivorans]|uniref:SDR family oxidoreductase n=1 Tax=Rhodococcus aetherivorans TaxID=191292 RepID=UPI002948DB73|nr:SDR family NAD(P)-dependent oxidoreductase [Rhodococcus aetherivorans]MDV6293388.1 SDR family NAD(P)-dependent oxidoreductase [Rhodococcus aetherivorans]
MNPDHQQSTPRARVAFITGAAGGIGRGIAEHLAELGYSLGLSDISEVALQTVANDIADATGVAVSARAADLADRQSIQAAVDATVADLGGLDVLVNCAGILEDARIEKMDPAVFRQVIEVNLIGMLTTTAAALPALRCSGSGRIISLTSRAWLGNFGSTNYAASKGGIAGVSRSLSLSLAPDGITVNCIAPGFIETPMSNSMPAHILDRVRHSIPVGRVGRPIDVARAVAFLGDANAGYVTGQSIPVCGGRSISGSIRKDTVSA